ncbi:PhzF family phenazine biosynthesis protein [Siphonobacter aquaeclarae]|uniref:Phenazine biosynthesis protein PhzF family n=1 Tax=Siphonobacter aquaeclarae TaxID=563176 RepID=A0A1G9JY74_9BACT|nr:PhzF family phenazine biosynthesis protein [Siphonobacter aquaeclarae]SDL42372.1 phenazine biosynthesis protein PhzF family [Siphonobacter aquaeclarae]
MTLTMYQVDAFARQVFTGNPAAICLLANWLDDSLMQQIAMENNLAETAFVVANGNRYDIRWFTPTVEVDLCGHATLAAAYILFRFGGVDGDRIDFHSHRSGPLGVARAGELLTLNFPTDEYHPVPLTPELTGPFNRVPKEAYRGKTDYMLVFDSEDDIRALEPRMREVAAIQARGIIATAPGTEVDFVSRFFGPASGIDEDPVTGSAHTTLIPYWANRLGKTKLAAVQLSSRTGKVTCTYLEKRVEIGGNARLFMKGEIYLPND